MTSFRPRSRECVRKIFKTNPNVPLVMVTFYVNLRVDIIPRKWNKRSTSFYLRSREHVKSRLLIEIRSNPKIFPRLILKFHYHGEYPCEHYTWISCLEGEIKYRQVFVPDPVNVITSIDRNSIKPRKFSQWPKSEIKYRQVFVLDIVNMLNRVCWSKFYRTPKDSQG